MLFKTIIQGRIEFGTKKAYDMAVKMFVLRAENYFKNDILFTVPDIFFEDELCLSIPRLVQQVYGKSFKNTATLLEYIVQFGVSGEMDIWQLEEGKILMYKHLEPSSDKMAVQSYIKGKNLVDEKGKEEEAIKALDKAIEKYDRHAQAYERRGKVNFKLKKYHDALRDYNKCLALDPDNPYAYYGKALVLLSEKKKEEAVENFQPAIAKSVAHQAIHWKARRNKGKLHLELGEYLKAEFELMLFSRREFTEDNPNFLYKREGHFLYAKALAELEKYTEAIEQFNLSFDLEKGHDKISKAEIIRRRGLAKQQAGLNGFKKDFKDAAELGDKKAAALI